MEDARRRGGGLKGMREGLTSAVRLGFLKKIHGYDGLGYPYMIACLWSLFVCEYIQCYAWL